MLDQDKSLIDGFITISDKELENGIKYNSDTESLDPEQVRGAMVIGKTRRLRLDWRKICPKDYDNTDVSKIPPKKMKAVISGFESAGGLFISGKAGTFKSRCAWYLLAREFIGGSSIDCLNWYSMPELMWMEAGERRERVSKASECDLLLIDDFMKTKCTEAIEATLFAILERRCSSCLPFIITSNVKLDEIARFFTDNGGEIRAEAIQRRIRENSFVMESK